ncbi:virion morphogenesis protein, partial [Pseudoalteromonas sp. S1609]
ENLSIKQAGFLLRDLKGSSSKITCQIDKPARYFIGHTGIEHKQQQSFILNNAMQVG